MKEKWPVWWCYQTILIDRCFKHWINNDSQMLMVMINSIYPGHHIYLWPMIINDLEVCVKILFAKQFQSIWIMFSNDNTSSVDSNSKANQDQIHFNSYNGAIISSFHYDSWILLDFPFVWPISLVVTPSETNLCTPLVLSRIHSLRSKTHIFLMYTDTLQMDFMCVLVISSLVFLQIYQHIKTWTTTTKKLYSMIMPGSNHWFWVII